MDLPAVLSVEFDFQREWWVLKSPAIMKGFGLLNKRLISSGGQSPLGQETEKQSTGPVSVESCAPMTSRVSALRWER